MKPSVRPSVLLDVDGVLADFVSAALTHLHQISGDRVDPETITSWEVFDSVPEHLRSYRGAVYSSLADRGGCFGIPIYDGAKAAVSLLCEVADVTIVTSPFSGSPTWMHEREQWLVHHFGIDRRHIIHATEKHRVHGDVFIDDKTSHLNDWSTYWSRSGSSPAGRAVLWDTPRSANDVVSEGVVRAKSWADVFAVVEEVRSALTPTSR